MCRLPLMMWTLDFTAFSIFPEQESTLKQISLTLCRTQMLDLDVQAWAVCGTTSLVAGPQTTCPAHANVPHIANLQCGDKISYREIPVAKKNLMKESSSAHTTGACSSRHRRHSGCQPEHFPSSHSTASPPAYWELEKAGKQQFL